MNQQSGRNSVPLVPIRPPPPPPVSSTAASGNKLQQDATASNSKKAVMNLSKLLPKRMQKQNVAPSVGVKKAVPPPRPPPPKIAPKQPVLIDLLSGSPPSSPSPTLRSQESGFEESPDVWRSWPDSSNSTPQVDWSLGSTAPTNSSTNQSNSDPWDVEWPTTTASSGWATFESSDVQQRQLSEVRSTTMPAICNNSAPTTSSSTFYAGASAVPQTVRSAPSMPTIIRPGPSKKLVKKIEEPVVEDDSSLAFSPPMPSFPPPQPPPEVEEVSSESTNFLVVAVYDYESDHPEDLNFKAGDVIEVLSAVNEDWYTGQCGDRVGHFPSNFVEPQ